MENILWVTRNITKNSTVLLVDVQEKYFQEVEVSDTVQMRIKERLNIMKAKLTELKACGYTIYAVVDETGIHPLLEGIPDFYLPAWSYGMNEINSIDPAERYILHPQIIDTFSKGDSDIMVCGLWKELCLYTVTRLLQKEGMSAYLSIDPDISFENAMMWEDDDNISLESECQNYGVSIKLID